MRGSQQIHGSIAQGVLSRVEFFVAGGPRPGCLAELFALLGGIGSYVARTSADRRWWFPGRFFRRRRPRRDC